jgi:predicted Zn finger-like uncharacterized protein
MSVAIVCPNCQRTSRTNREQIRVGAKTRCPGCGDVFYLFLHANGAVELRPADPPTPSGETLGLPPRVGESAAPSRRNILTSRRKNRPLGGYMPFEKSRSYIGVFWFVGAVGIVSLVAYAYLGKINEISNASGRSAAKGNIWASADEKKRKDFQERSKKAVEALEARKKASQTDGTPRTQDGSSAEPR